MTSRWKGRLLAAALLPAIGLVVAPAQAAQTFANPAFASVWTRTDSPVASQVVKRTWFWGPQPNSGGLYEEYKEGDGGKRLVQYFDKSRMEVNDPDADPAGQFYVTNGLLTVELISGRMQTGNNSFVARQPAQINVTGDAGDALAPTYAELAGVSSAGAGRDRRDPDRTGQPSTATLDNQARVGNDASKAQVPGVKIAYYEKTTGHNVPQVTWDFLNSAGPVSSGGRVLQEKLITPWFYASGLPISDPYWVRATIAGKPTDVLLQAFERRVLTYVPTNPEGFNVEMGNIGQHYYQWRYASAPPSPAPTSSPMPTPSPPPELSRFTVDIIEDFSPSTLDTVKASGAGAVRIYLYWRALEPANVPPSQYNWAFYDSKLKALSDRGLQPIVLITECPSWACSIGGGPIRVERVGDFVEFTAALAARYGKPPYNAHYWEFWNEPDAVAGSDIKYNWGLYGARYAAMLRAVRPGMKAADPWAKLVMGGMAYDNFQEAGGAFNRRFADDVLDAGGGQALDVFNFHYYPQNLNWCSYTAKLNELRGKLNARGLKIPVMTTETGFTSDPEFFSSSDEMQSLYVAQVYAQASGEGVLSLAWFLAKDFNTDIAGWKVFQKSGLVDLAGAPKPSHQAYKVAVAQIGQRPGRALGDNEGVTGSMRGYEFSADAAHQGSLWVIWTWDLNPYGNCGAAPQPRDFTIEPARARNVKRVLDMYGQPLSTRSRPDGSLVFSLDARPVYVEWSR
jgi:hypothetical protein